MLQEFNLNHKPLNESVRKELAWWRTWSMTWWADVCL
ncbi:MULTISPECIES: Trp operon leader peptide [Vibrio]|uniref:Trp operon leader peptide n=2 Tax=Vibrio TaxID=662 RepID=A0A7X4RUV6_9VIBR|nr:MULTISPECIES: Trp operon leader peptide [Vibrio]MBF9000074.1 Trp operon leader peptide [Vibrio nitrifigilis]MZI93667.1 Trp operon leader peptide [Vibrio eleionomae]